MTAYISDIPGGQATIDLARQKLLDARSLAGAGKHEEAQAAVNEALRIVNGCAAIMGFELFNTYMLIDYPGDHPDLSGVEDD